MKGRGLGAGWVGCGVKNMTTRGEIRVAGRVGWEGVGVGNSVFSLLELACLA